MSVEFYGSASEPNQHISKYIPLIDQLKIQNSNFKKSNKQKNAEYQI